MSKHYKQAILQKMTMKFIYTLALIFATIYANAQTNPLRLNPNIVLPKDSIESKNLTTSLNDFLFSAQKPNEDNKFVFESEKIETFIQLDEVYGIEKSGKYKDDFFYKPYLTNVVLLKDNNYLIQISYIGTNESMAMLRASFEFIAHKINIHLHFLHRFYEILKSGKRKKLATILFTIKIQSIKKK